ncbi:DUF3667 domain-containing protein [Sphingomonas pseudosanguinis]|uniref:DUF3667 domain-containing protein n=1 Tax=Sphingomonas pseudosanguinis TaxID=413712 RepID=A0A7W6F3C9_9SPHN|nr:DUF3667 domain-containing protein [Sphingomonas pseudosanguinis]MBB3879240.1 hypothetical protein [Sphingomonas pseudosanguinis]MBN3535275.1 DUF3667 domain-containing protein [Sphingomonas pseudosanguinis]
MQTEGHGAGAARCLNCGADLVGDYCHVCGQSTHIHRTLGAWWHDFSHGVLHIEGQVWRTIAFLFTRPGELTRRYIAGERRRFLSPLALYLFSVFLLYIAYSTLGGFATLSAPGTEQAVTELRAEVTRTEGRIAALDRQRAAMLATRQDVTAIDRQRARLAERQHDLEVTSMALGGDLTEASANGESHGARRITGWQSLDEKIVHAIRDPELLIFKMEANGYKFSWALILISMPFMGLLFAWKRGVAIFDHAVFVTYSLSFICLLMVAMILWTRAAHLPGVGLLMLAFPVHLFQQVRGAYRLGRPAALVMTVAILMMAMLVLSLWIIALLALGMAH